MSIKPQRYTVFLPSTPCTPEMREKVIEIARREKVSIAQVQRVAISLFLSEFDKELSNTCKESDR